MKDFKASLAIVAALCLVSTAVPASADPLKNIVLVHGAWVDASGWKPVYDILKKDGFNVTMVQEPETSFPDDVAATKRVLDLQDGPTLLVGQRRLDHHAGRYSPKRRWLGVCRGACP
jgi:hypothetical protein